MKVRSTFFFFFFFPLGMQEVCKVQPSQNITEENVLFLLKTVLLKTLFFPFNTKITFILARIIYSTKPIHVLLY